MKIYRQKLEAIDFDLHELHKGLRGMAGKRERGERGEGDREVKEEWREREGGRVKRESVDGVVNSSPAFVCWFFFLFILFYFFLPFFSFLLLL